MRNQLVVIAIIILLLFLLSGCGPTKTAGVEPCNILTVIPPAPKDINRILVSRRDARAHVRALAVNEKKVRRYKCRR